MKAGILVCARRARGTSFTEQLALHRETLRRTLVQGVHVFAYGPRGAALCRIGSMRSVSKMCGELLLAAMICRQEACSIDRELFQYSIPPASTKYPESFGVVC